MHRSKRNEQRRSYLNTDTRMTYHCHFCHYPIAAALFSLSVQCFSHAFVYPVTIHPLPSGRRTFGYGETTTNLYSKSSGDADSSKERKGFGGKGFGSNDRKYSRRLVEALDKTYGEEQTMKYKDIIIDNEAAMSEFFATNAEWHPLFRSIMMAENASKSVEDIKENNFEAVAAFHILSSVPEGEIVYDDYSPWKKLDAIPTQKEKLDVVATWLDSVQKSLVDIPVDERNTEKDDLDMHFINEGKRLLAITRFHVVLNDNPSSSSFELYHRDELFRTCWSELAELRRADQPDTGSIILLPGYDAVDVRRFTDMNLRRPLDWLGVSATFEVASFNRGVISAIRMLHKLSDIPTDEELAQRQQL